MEHQKQNFVTIIAGIVGFSLGGIFWLYYFLIEKVLTDNFLSVAMKTNVLLGKVFDWSLNPLVVLPLGTIAIFQLIMILRSQSNLATNWPIFTNLGILLGWLVAFHGQEPQIWLLLVFVVLTAINGISNFTWLAFQLRN